MNWIHWSRVEKYLNDNDIKIAFDNDGAVCYTGNTITHLDIYDMDGTAPAYETVSVECKISDVKDVFAVLFENWELSYNELVSTDE